MKFTAILWMALLIGVYIASYLLNKKTPKPEGCEDLLSGCSGCNDISCSHNSAHKEEEQ